MSEGRAKDERERLRREQEERTTAQQKERINAVIKEIRENFAGIEALLPEKNPQAWKALLFLIRKLRQVRVGWHNKVLDSRTAHTERDVLLGQYNAVLLLFDLVEQFRELHKKLVPGHEEENVGAILFRNPHTQR